MMWYLAEKRSGKSSYQLLDINDDLIVKAVDGASTVFNSKKRKEAFETIDTYGSTSDKAVARLSAGGGVLFTTVAAVAGVAAGGEIITSLGTSLSAASTWAASTPIGTYLLYNSDKIINRADTGTGAIQTVQEASKGNWSSAFYSALGTVGSFLTGKMMNMPRTANNAPVDVEDFTSVGNFNIPKNKQQIDFIEITNMNSYGTGVGKEASVPEVNPYRLRAEMLKEKYSNLSPSERSAKLQQLAEENAYRRLQEMQDSIPGAHFLDKHGSQTTLQSQLDRVQYAVNPTTKMVETWPNGNLKYPSSATRFLSNRDQLNAIQRAQQILKNTGDKTKAEVPINFNYIIGSGYKRNPLQYGESYLAQVWFNNSNQPITAFPIWGQ